MGRKWKLSFSPDKSALMVFSRSRRPATAPFIFIRFHRFRSVPNFKFLGVTRLPLTWKPHINLVAAHCIHLKNLFSTIAKINYGPSTKPLVHLLKTLVQSKIDYGLVAYGSASHSNLSKIDVVSRAIMRTILDSKSSTPNEMLYADLSLQPIEFRKTWLSLSYAAKLGQNHTNSGYRPAYNLFYFPKAWPKRSTPCLVPPFLSISQQGIEAFSHNPDLPVSPSNFLPPWQESPCRFSFCPISKRAAMANRPAVISLFNGFISRLPDHAVVAYSDGSVSEDRKNTACAVHIPLLVISCSWLLQEGSSIFSAELHGILQALQLTAIH